MRGATLLVAVLLSAAVAAATAFAGAGKFELLGPMGGAPCDGSEVPIRGSAGGFGFAVFNASPEGTIAATVVLKSQPPHATFVVRLIQGEADCFTVDGTITVNGKGNGVVHLSEPSVSSTALIGIDEGALFASNAYVSQTYRH